MIRRVLILGHTGFIGSALAEVFRASEPRVEVIGMSTPEIDLTANAAAVWLEKFFEPQTAVLMCAAIKRQRGDTLENFLKNLSMVTHLSPLLQERSVGRFVYFSSAAVYGEDVHNTRITEETAVCPRSYYGMVKFASECLLHKACEKHDPSPLVVLRPATVYGPGQRWADYGPTRFVQAAVRGQPITLWGDGTELREFVYLRDLVVLVHRLTFLDFSGVLNVVSGTSHSFAEALEITSRLRPFEKPIVSQSRTKEKVDHGFNNTDLQRLFPDFTFTPMERGIRDLFEEERKAAPSGRVAT